MFFTQRADIWDGCEKYGRSASRMTYGQNLLGDRSATCASLIIMLMVGFQNTLWLDIPC